MATDSKARFLRDAEKFVLQGKIQQAINEYLKIIRIDPDDVLTMNTLGDLYLREGRITEASKCFAAVAQNYTSNNFLLKAIAVYKKILNSDPNNLEINKVLAELYVRQGLMVEARHQFLRIAEICTREGKNREMIEAYEKVAELDPANASVRLRLAEIYLAGGAKDKTALCLAGAARAQFRAGDAQAAAQTYRRALELAPTDIEIMKGYLETVAQLGDAAAAVDQIRRALDILPEDVLLREMLGNAYLAAGDPRSAAEIFRGLVAEDEGQFESFLALPGAYLAAGDVEEAARCLDPVIPILINRRATNEAIQSYHAILGEFPDHEPTLTRLADIYSATNNQLRYVEILDQLIELELQKGNPAGAIAFIEKILQINPRSEKHLRLHERAFADAFPDTPYVPPALAAEAPVEAPTSFLLAMGGDRGGEGVFDDSDSRLVEIDLLINYGMKPKALE
ncbi:MAG: tetratricopeptide repeat protein, partial [Acidobacteria bacterium]|nr:tetratricopeptide repeat protein [Acidobacteriota bacterium]